MPIEMEAKTKKNRLISDPWTYILIYIPYFSLQTGMMAFLPLYIKELGFSPLEVATVTSAENLATIFGPPLLMGAAWGSRLIPNIHLRYGLLSLALFLPLLMVKSFLPFFILWLGVLLFNRTTFGLVNQTALNEDRRGSFSFSRVRLWGSVAFIVATMIIGVLVRRFSTTITLGIVLVSLAGIAALAYRLDPGPEESGTKQSETTKFNVRDFWPWKLPGRTCCFLLAVALLWTSHGPYYTFISIHLDRLGWSAPLISVSWSIGVGAEVVMFLLYASIEKRLTQLDILRLSLLITAARWALLSICHSTAAILALQTLHAFSFATSYVASMKLIEPLLPERLRSGSQAVLMSFGTGIGALAGKVFAGTGAAALTGSGIFAAYNKNAQSEFYFLYWASAVVALLGYFSAMAVRDPETPRAGKAKLKPPGGVLAEQLPPEP